MSVYIDNVDVDTDALRRLFAKMSARSKDFDSVFRWAMRHLAEEHAKLFATNGNTLGSTPWEPLKESTVAWKLANGYGAQGILVRDGTLKSSLTDLNSSRGAIRDVGRTEASFGTNVEYAGYHFYGTRRMASRKPLFVPAHFAWRTATATAKHIVYGQIPKNLNLLIP